jgi:hypothetical protein
VKSRAQIHVVWMDLRSLDDAGDGRGHTGLVASGAGTIWSELLMSAGVRIGFSFSRLIHWP